MHLCKKRDIRGLQNSIKAGREEKKGGGGEGREGKKKKTVKKVFLSNTLARLNCPESFSARACKAEAGLRGGEEQGPSFPATNGALARGGNMIRQNLVHRCAVIWGFVPFSLPQTAPRDSLMELSPACWVAPAPPAPFLTKCWWASPGGWCLYPRASPPSAH